VCRVADEHTRHVAEIIQHAGARSQYVGEVPAPPTRLCRQV
jgi:hypothetical protein